MRGSPPLSALSSSPSPHVWHCPYQLRTGRVGDKKLPHPPVHTPLLPGVPRSFSCRRLPLILCQPTGLPHSKASWASNRQRVHRPAPPATKGASGNTVVCVVIGSVLFLLVSVFVMALLFLCCSLARLLRGNDWLRLWLSFVLRAELGAQDKTEGWFRVEETSCARRHLLCDTNALS